MPARDAGEIAVTYWNVPFWVQFTIALAAASPSWVAGASMSTRSAPPIPAPPEYSLLTEN